MDRRRKVVTFSLAIASVVVLVTALWRPAVEQWYLWKLEHSDFEERQAAARVLGNMQSTRAVALLENVLERGDFEERLQVLWVLAHLGERALPILLKALQDDGFNVRWVAAITLVHMGHQRRETVPVFLEGAKTAANSLYYLGKLGPAGEDAVPKLEEMVKDRTWPSFIRNAAGAALQRIRGKQPGEPEYVFPESFEESFRKQMRLMNLQRAEEAR